MQFINIFAHWVTSGNGYCHTCISLHVVSLHCSRIYCWSEIQVILAKKMFSKEGKVEHTHKNTAVIPSTAVGSPTFFHSSLPLLYSVFGQSLCTYKRCWKWCPWASIQAWTCLILFINTITHFTGIALQPPFSNWVQWNNSTLQRQLRYWQPNLRTIA
jgi:hypothetical protein